MRKFLLLAVFILISCSFVLAQEQTTAPETSSKPRIDIGVGYWYTWSSLDLELFAATDSLFTLAGDKVSELNYDLDTGLIVANVDAYLFWRLYADGFVGFGDIDDGEQIDSDWLFPQLIADKALESKANAAGDVTTWNANAYIRILEEEDDKGYLDVGVGYLYYQDDIEHITDLVYTIFAWEPANLPIDGLDSSDKYTFDGVRLGARARLRVHDRVAIKASGGIVPWLGVEKEWNWNLAGHHGDGEAEGTAIDFNIAIEIKITKNLFIEGGYKYINLDSDNGDLTWNYDTGLVVETEDNWNVDADRGGFYAMGRLKI